MSTDAATGSSSSEKRTKGNTKNKRNFRSASTGRKPTTHSDPNFLTVLAVLTPADLPVRVKIILERNDTCGTLTSLRQQYGTFVTDDPAKIDLEQLCNAATQSARLYTSVYRANQVVHQGIQVNIAKDGKSEVVSYVKPVIYGKVRKEYCDWLIGMARVCHELDFKACLNAFHTEKPKTMADAYKIALNHGFDKALYEELSKKTKGNSQKPRRESTLAPLNGGFK